MRKALSLALILCASCVYTSPPPERAPVVRETKGSQGTVVLNDGARLDGELLEVGDSSLALFARNRLVVAPFTEIARAEFGTFRTSLLSRRAAARTTIEEGRRASRFSFGMTAQARDGLLQSLSQTSVDTVRAVRR
jgi:hypothetical protein